MVCGLWLGFDMILEGVIGPRGMIVEVIVVGPDGTARGEGMIDTGARTSCLDDAGMKKIGAKAISYEGRRTICGNVDMPVVEAAVTIAGGPPDGLYYPKARLMVGQNLGHLMLLGRDVLALGTLHYDGAGKWFRFETP